MLLAFAAAAATSSTASSSFPIAGDNQQNADADAAVAVATTPLGGNRSARNASSVAASVASGILSSRANASALRPRSSALGAAGPLSQTVVLIRHGEKEGGGDDLNPRGYQRAACLAAPDRLGGAGLTHLFAYTDKASRRSVETITPLANATGLSIDTRFGRDDVRALAAALRALPADAKLLVCWEHKVLTDIAAALGVDDPPKYGSDDFDVMWTVREGELAKGREHC